MNSSPATITDDLLIASTMATTTNTTTTTTPPPSTISSTQSESIQTMDDAMDDVGVAADEAGDGDGGRAAADRSITATLTNWEGPIAIESSSAYCNAVNFQQHTKRRHSDPNHHNAINDDTSTGNASSSSSGSSSNSDSSINDRQQRRHSAEQWNRYRYINGSRSPQVASILQRINSAGIGISSTGAGAGISGIGGGEGSSGGISALAAAAALRMGLFSRQALTGSSLLGDSMTEIRIEDLQNDNEPTSALLDYCKRKFLRPYLGILSLVALNPISTDTTLCRSSLSYLQALLVLTLLLFGYGLQYLCCYRGDRGFSNYSKTLPPAVDLDDTDSGGTGAGTGGSDPLSSTRVRTIGELIFGHIIPNGLSLAGYAAAVIVCKTIGQEQLQNLIERSFLMSMKPRHLCRMLWVYVACGGLLLCLLFGYVVPSVLMQPQIGTQFKWLEAIVHEWKMSTKLTLLLTLFMQDLVEIIILTSYCIECYLLRVHLATLSHKLLMHSIDSQDWMREMLEFRKLLEHLNQRVAIPVCFFIVMNLAYAFAGLVYMFNDFDFHYSAIKVVILNIINVSLWLLMGLLPFFSAASVTRVCQRAQGNGHQIRVRPFVYHNTSAEDLNSTLLFASSLEMSAKLFRMPIQSNYLCFAILVISIVVLTLGMCVNLIDLGSF